MPFEYTVIPAPSRGEKARDAKTPTDRYALAVASELNRMAREGWEYLRADVLPSEERSGLTGRTTTYHNLLVFRRETTGADAAPAARDDIPQPEYPAAASPARAPQPTPALPDAASPRPAEQFVADQAQDAQRFPTPRPDTPVPPKGDETQPPAPRMEPNRD